jgi:thiol-activated cytolysin
METKTKTIARRFTILLMTLLLSYACSKDSADLEEIPEASNPDTNSNPDTEINRNFQAVVDNGGDFDPTTTSEQQTNTAEDNEVIDGEVWNCTTTTYSALSPGGGDKGFPLFNPNASVIYPGSLLQGSSLKNATPDIIAVERAGGTISYDLNNGNTSSSFSVDKVAKSSIQDAMNQIIANSPSDLPANFVFTYSQVSSEESMAFNMGVDYESAFKSISADFGFSQDKSYNRILVELNQSFYTMSFDIPTSLDGLFDASVSSDDLARYVGPGNPATYISDVTYGRIYYMLIESTSSYTEMEAAVSAEFSGVAASAEVDIDASYISDLSELKVKVMAFGGESSSTLLSVGNNNLSELVALLAKSATISTGLPISYVVRSVKSNQIVGVQLATEYDVTTCTPAAPGGEPTYTAFWKGEVLERMGPVGAGFAVQGTDMVLISKDGKQFMKSNNVRLEGPFPIEELGTTGEYPFGDVGVGAACNIGGNIQPEGTIMVISSDGQYFSYILANGMWLNKEPIIKLITDTKRQNENPFINRGGVGAMFFENSTARWMFDINGQGFALYNRTNNGSFENYQNTDSWPTDSTMPFDRIGGGVGFYIGAERFMLMFDSTGTEYIIVPEIGSGALFGPFEL